MIFAQGLSDPDMPELCVLILRRALAGGQILRKGIVRNPDRSTTAGAPMTRVAELPEPTQLIHERRAYADSFCGLRDRHETPPFQAQRPCTTCGRAAQPDSGRRSADCPGPREAHDARLPGWSS